MKLINKDGKLRMYDGTGAAAPTIYTVDTVAIDNPFVSLTVTPDPGWTHNIFAGTEMTVVTGQHAGSKYRINSNDSDTIGLAYVESVGWASGDTFSLNEGPADHPWYFEFCLDNGDFSAPLESPNHEQTLIMSRGKFTGCSHYVIGNDMPIMEPIDISFSVMVNDSQKFMNLLDWLEGNTVNGNTVLTTKGQHERVDIFNAQLLFRDTTKKTVDIEYRLVGDNDTIVYVYNEVYFDLGAQQMTEAEDGVNITLTGRCYGSIQHYDDFKAGNDVNA